MARFRWAQTSPNSRRSNVCGRGKERESLSESESCATSGLSCRGSQLAARNLQPAACSDLDWSPPLNGAIKRIRGPSRVCSVERERFRACRAFRASDARRQRQRRRFAPLSRAASRRLELESHKFEREAWSSLALESCEKPKPKRKPKLKPKPEDRKLKAQD